MKLCVLLPDYSTTEVDYKLYDPPRDLQPLIPEHEVHTVFLNKLTTYKQLQQLSTENYDCYINLCEGYLEWEVPSIEVIMFLERLQLPFSGPNSTLYDPSKPVMKYVAYCQGVDTPAGTVVVSNDDIKSQLDRVCSRCAFPLFVKPAKAGDSLGIDEHSCVNNREELDAKVNQLTGEYPEILVEQYIAGREYTVLVVAGEKVGECHVYRPLEYRFRENRSFKTYALKTSELHGDCNVPCDDSQLDERLRTAARAIFRGFQGVGYARMDFRVDEHAKIYFLEVNFTCSVFYTDGYEGSADHILDNEEEGKRGFLLRIIKEGIARNQRARKVYRLHGDSIAGYGIIAQRAVAKGEIVFHGEERAQRIATKRWVDEQWDAEAQLDFRRYAYAIAPEVYILWDADPSEWAPQNHSCDANTFFDGLNVVAMRDIARGEEFTIDYATILDQSAHGFECRCGSPKCRGFIQGIKDNSLSAREIQRRNA